MKGRAKPLRLGEVARSAVKRFEEDGELASVRKQLSEAVLDLTSAKLELASTKEHLEVVSAHQQDLVRDCENLSDALAECVHLLDTCTPGGFRDRELGDLIRGYAMLAGAGASSVFDEANGKCCNPPPALAVETHLPCKWPAGHAGDHLWPARDPKASGITGQVPR